MNWKAFNEGFWCGANPLVAAAWILYWIGDLFSLAVRLSHSEFWTRFWYVPYNKCMWWSDRAQGSSKCGPWGDAA